MLYTYYRKIFQTLVLFFSICFFSMTYAWDYHYLITYLALKNYAPFLSLPEVSPETLGSFVSKEKNNIKSLLYVNELWAKQNLSSYEPLPEALNFNFTPTTNEQELTSSFIKALRINPELEYLNYLQYPYGATHKINRPLATNKAMLQSILNSPGIVTPIQSLPLEQLLPSDHVSPLLVVATASDEPDYGMDINLWVDSPSNFSKEYGFGDQPFGPATLLGSNAAFHMGFYFEKTSLNILAPEIKKTYPEYRIHTYLSLSNYAFHSGHPYWGYRFLGFALHYIQDLTQPYHVTVMPNNSTSKMIMAQLLSMIKLTSSKDHMVTLVGNRHLALENYTYHALLSSHTNEGAKSLIEALSNVSHDNIYPSYNDNYPRLVVAYEAHSYANSVDNYISQLLPKRLVNDPNYHFGSTEPEINAFAEEQKQPDNLGSFNAMLAELMKNVGSHTRNTVNYVLGVKK